MKKTISLAVTVLLAFNASAQFQKGNKVLGFGLNAGSSKTKLENTTVLQTNNSTSLGLSAELGFAVKENRLNGFFAGTDYSWNKAEFPNQPSVNYKNSYFSTNGGYFTRRYKKLGGDFFVFGEGRIGANYQQSINNVSSSSEDKMQRVGVNAGLYPGIAYKWNSRFLFEVRFADFVNVGYAWQKNKSANGNSSTQNGFNLGTSLGLGYLNNIGIGARWIIK
ncbi:MAG: hypothetical protein ACOVP7_03505 [Lacibacter sp.]